MQRHLPSQTSALSSTRAHQPPPASPGSCPRAANPPWCLQPCPDLSGEAPRPCPAAVGIQKEEEMLLCFPWYEFTQEKVTTYWAGLSNFSVVICSFLSNLLRFNPLDISARSPLMWRRDGVLSPWFQAEVTHRARKKSRDNRYDSVDEVCGGSACAQG